MIIFPIGIEKTITTPISLSARHINVANKGSSALVVNIIDLDGNIVSNFTILAQERLTIIKPDDYTLSAASTDILAIPVMRTQ